MDVATNGPRGRPALWWLAKYDPSWISGIGLAFLFVNSITTIIKNIHDPSTVAFVVFANLDVVLLYVCLRQFDAASSKGRESLKIAVWLLASILTALFCHRVAGIMPPVVAGIVWGMGAVSISASFYALFVYKDNEAPVAGKESTTELPPIYRNLSPSHSQLRDPFHSYDGERREPIMKNNNVDEAPETVNTFQSKIMIKLIDASTKTSMAAVVECL